MVNKLMYRSKQRGFLELDLLVGLWAEKELKHMSMESLNSFSTVLDQENPDLFKWLTGQMEPSPDMMANAAFRSLHVHVTEQLSESSVLSTRAAAGRDWVRGWDDNWRENPQSAAAIAKAGAAKAAAAAV
ncbi:MAG: hypothetical protein WDW36_000756 [Sanguina aurantia]